MTREERIRSISIICDKCGCSDKLSKLHFEQFVKHDWQPHASQRFKRWWAKHPMNDGTPPVIAQNVKVYWDEYLEAKQIGAA